ncbi:MAG: glycerophosphoryl diester phosphodiesterase [Chloroflexota bacterium]|nr:glycerophosphoryl diester phosphodiesterase [Chloroflexota bacterium]
MTDRAILFAHRGASALAPENSLTAFRLALELGATGLESDVHVSRDGVAILVHDPVEIIAGRRVVVGDTEAAELERLERPSLRSLYRMAGNAFALSLDLNDADPLAAATAVIQAAEESGPDALGGLLLCHGRLRVLEAIRRRHPDVGLVHSTAPRYMTGMAAHAQRLADLDVVAVNLRWSDWDADRVGGDAIAAAHEAGLRAFAWDTQTVELAARMLDQGVDGIYADDPSVLVEAARRRASSAALEGS